jgi:hypothetical protein
MDIQSGRAAGSKEHGPVYNAIERALWVLGPVLILFLILNVPAMQAAREQREADTAADIAPENLEYCTKWGMPAGAARYDDCVRDLARIRDRVEHRLRDQIVGTFRG